MADTLHTLPPELAIDQERLKRQQAIADAMIAQGRQPIQGGMAGRYYVGASPLQGLAQLANAYGGAQLSKQADQGMAGLGKRYNEGLADAVRAYTASGQPTEVQRPDMTGQGMTGSLDEQDMPRQPEMVAPDPGERIKAAMLSQYGPVRELAKFDIGQQNRKEDKQADREARAENLAATREQRAADIEQQGRQKLEQIEAAAREGRITREEADKRANQARQDMIRLAASLRPAPQERQPQIIQTEGGPMQVGAGGTATPIVGPDGQPIKAKGTEKALPAGPAKALLENQQNLRRAQQAVSLITGEDITDAAGNVVMKADKSATGNKAFLSVLGAPGDKLLNYMDPKGVDARAAIGDLGSIVIHDRSGAAVTAAEYPRLRPFIPQATDSPTVAAQKARRFANEYEKIQQETTDFYRESGYKVPTETLRPTSGPAATTQPKRVVVDY